VLNNIKGTLLTAEMAGRYGVERFVNISTDKAVEPVNIMGATKRAGELIVRMLAQRYPRTMYASVRFGNVLGSQGSVIPIFRSQIEAGGPVTITHPDMTRYFMLIEEAVQLLLQAAIMLDEEGARDQDELNTFILEMGNPVHIVDLAQRMIDFYWKNHEHSLGVEFSGLRPGEKLDERLLYAFEEAAQTDHPLVKRVSSKISRSTATGLQFEQHLADLIALAEDHAERREIVRAVMSCVPEYEPLERLTLEKPTVVV